jgi:hypothetical protein
MAQMTGLVGGLLRSCLKNSPMMGFDSLDRSKRRAAIIGREETTDKGLDRGKGV